MRRMRMPVQATTAGKRDLQRRGKGWAHPRRHTQRENKRAREEHTQVCSFFVCDVCAVSVSTGQGACGPQLLYHRGLAVVKRKMQKSL